MEVSIYTGNVRNDETGKERRITKLVCDNEILWSGPDGEVCTVSFVAYSSDPLARVEYELRVHGTLHAKGEYLTQALPLFDAVYRGQSRIDELLFKEIFPKLIEP